MPIDAKYWFPAKRYGWGWGIPVTWQGWLVIVVFVALVAGGAVVIRPREHIAFYLVYVGALACVLTAVCWFKGEPARWRWGED